MVVHAALETLHNKVEALVKSAGVDVRYVFMNDANIYQSMITFYGVENVKRLNDVQGVL